MARNQEKNIFGSLRDRKRTRNFNCHCHLVVIVLTKKNLPYKNEKSFCKLLLNNFSVGDKSTDDVNMK